MSLTNTFVGFLGWFQEVIDTIRDFIGDLRRQKHQHLKSLCCDAEGRERVLLIFFVVENLVTNASTKLFCFGNYEMGSWMSRLWRDTDLLSNSESECISRKKIDEIPRFHGEAWRKESKVVFQTSEEFRLRYTYMGVSKNRGVSPQIIHFNRVFHYFPHPFWRFFPRFLVQHPYTTHIHHRPTWSLSSHGLSVLGLQTKDDGWKFRGRSWELKFFRQPFFSESHIHILHPSHPFPTSTRGGCQSWEPF